jgi:hypothetical protein
MPKKIKAALVSSDEFVLRAGDGDKVITGFDGDDRILFDYGSYSDVLGPLGSFADGQSFSNFIGTAVWTIDYQDANNDGQIDAVVTVDYAGGRDSITLLGVSSLNSGDFFGG